MSQNETIRINIEINDRDIRDLNDVISDLQITLRDLNGTLSNSMSQVQNTVREFSPLEMAVNKSSRTLDTLRTVLMISTMSLQNIKTNLKLLTGTTNIFTNATTGAKVVMNKKTTSMRLATAAATGLKWAMKAIPFVGIITLAGSLITTFARWASSTDNAGDSFSELTDRINRNREAHEKRRQEIQHEMNNTNKLIGTLVDLQSEEGYLNGKRWTSIDTIRKLNERLGDLNLTYDINTGRLDENGQAVLELIQQYVNLRIATENMATDQERLTQLTQEYAEIELELEQLAEDLDNATDSVICLVSGNVMLGEESRKLAEEQGYLIERQQDLRGETKELESQVIESALVMAQAVADGTWGQIVSWDHLNDNQRGVINQMVGTYEWLTTQATNAFRKIGYGAEISMADMNATLYHNLGYVESWGKDIATIYDRIGEEAIPEGFMPWLEEMERSTPGVLATVANSTQAELDEFIGLFKKTGPTVEGTMRDAVGEEFDEVLVFLNRFGPQAEKSLRNGITSTDFAGNGSYMVNRILEVAQKAASDGAGDLTLAGAKMIFGLQRGIGDTARVLNPTMLNIATNMIQTFRDANDENSPSREYMRSGEKIIAGLIRGLEKNQCEPTSRIQKLAQNMQRVYNNANRDYTTIGRSVMTGLNQGLLNGENSVMNTARRIANSIASTMRNALDINSPSRVMREQIGRQIPAGVAAGIDKYANYAIDSVYDLGHDLVKVKIPNVNDIIKMGPGLNFAGADSQSSNITNVDRTNDNRGLFEGATINWHGKQDIRETMEEIAWEIQSQDARFI